MVINTKTENLTFVWEYHTDGEGRCSLYVDGKVVSSWHICDWGEDAITEAKKECLECYVGQLFR